MRFFVALVLSLFVSFALISTAEQKLAASYDDRPSSVPGVFSVDNQTVALSDHKK